MQNHLFIIWYQPAFHCGLRFECKKGNSGGGLNAEPSLSGGGGRHPHTVDVNVKMLKNWDLD